jgi:thymidylate kinase
MEKGKLIVLYGINNLGKSTQAKLLVENLRALGHPTEYLKYPLYNLEPAGPMINGYLRGGNPFNLTSREMQMLHTLNRTQYQPELIAKLDAGTTIIAEDYVGTGLAWGIGAGVDENFLKTITKHLYKEDLAFLFDGERFLESIETGHKHENDHELMEKVRTTHQRLGAELGWHPIDANQSIENISEEILKIVKSLLVIPSVSEESLKQGV